MLLHQKILINDKYSKNIYNNIEKEHITKNVFYIDAYDLPNKSNKKVLVRCDYCGEITTIKYNDYNKCIENNQGVYYCKNCRKHHILRTVKEKYNVDNISNLEEVKAKKKETCNKNFGCDWPMQNKNIYEKAKNKMIEKYGVEHNLQREDIITKVMKDNAKIRSENGNIQSSKAQRHICKLLNGKLNAPCDFYNMDILLNNNIYIEYNGSGHNLNVKLQQITQEEFDKKEMIRYQYLKSKGYKAIIFDNISNKLPNDSIIIQIVNQCIKILDTNNWVRVNLDTLEITTK